jgi:hypothetical protein
MPMSSKLLRPRNAWTPRSIAGLQLWLDGSDSSTLTLNGSTVSQWNDKSGGSRNATQSTANNQPTLESSSLNNRSTLTFDGTSDDMAGSLSYTLTAQTVVIVARITSASGSGPAFARLFTQGLTASTSAGNQDYELTGHFIPFLRNSNTNQIGSYADSSVRAGVNITQNAWFVACSRHTGTQIQNSFNNGTAQTYSHTLSRAYERYRIGNDLASFQTGWWPGGVAEVLVYNRSITDEERNTLLRALGTKWGIAVS